MKSLFAIPLVLTAMISPVRAQAAPRTAMRDAVTHDQLSQQQRTAEQADPMRKLQPTKGADPTLANPPKDILSMSDIICFGGMATLVPKQAILNVPKNMQDRLKFVPGSKVRTWADFFALNRGWITTVEITRPQAEGNEPIDEKIAERFQKSNNLVVATYKGGPISKLPMKVQEESQAAKEQPKITKP